MIKPIRLPTWPNYVFADRVQVGKLAKDDYLENKGPAFALVR